MKKSFNTKPAFTMIELLIVIAVIGILSGIFMTTINSRRQQETVINATRRQKLKETADLIEGFRTAEGFYPDDGPEHNPLKGDNLTIVSFYIKEWYQGILYYVNGNSFAIYIKSAISENYYKYSTNWSYIRECTPDGIGDVGTCNGGPDLN